MHYTQNRQIVNLGSMSLTSNFDSSYNSRFKNDKKYEVSEKLKGSDMI